MGQDNGKNYMNTLLWGLILLVVGVVMASIISAPFKGLRNDIPQIIKSAIKVAKDEINIKDITHEIAKSIKDEINIKDLVQEVSKQAKDQVVIQDIVEEINKGLKKKK